VFSHGTTKRKKVQLARRMSCILCVRGRALSRVHCSLQVRVRPGVSRKAPWDFRARRRGVSLGRMLASEDGSARRRFRYKYESSEVRACPEQPPDSCLLFLLGPPTNDGNAAQRSGSGAFDSAHEPLRLTHMRCACAAPTPLSSPRRVLRACRLLNAGGGLRSLDG
jgi:hypothetical protein